MHWSFYWYWYFGVMLIDVLWLVIFFMWGSRTCWHTCGITQSVRRVVIGLFVAITAVMILTGIVFWALIGSFHPVFAIIMIMGLMNIDPIRWALKWPAKVSSA